MATDTGYYWNPELEQRKTGFACPEVPERCRVLHPDSVLAPAGGSARHCGFASRAEDILLPVHDAEYIGKVRDASARGLRYLDAGETMVTPDLFPQALLSASAGVEALDAIFRGELTRAFCAVRPPGHHANRMRAMGFCIFNNAAVAAAQARLRHGVNRVLIVDWDVHPGNGTQEIFWDDPQVFTLSIHQDNLFQEAGGRELRGRGAGEGFNRNEPLPPDVPPENFVSLFAGAVREVAVAFQPELLLISAGFDAHRNDPASSMKLQAHHFAAMTEAALSATRPYTLGKTLSLLEGGYNLHALRTCVAEHVKALAAG